MARKIFHFIETILLFFLLWIMVYHYDPSISTPSFQLNNKVLYDNFRIIVDILIGIGLITRIFHLVRRKFNPLKTNITKLDLIIFIGYTVLVLPDLWVFTRWYYYANMYGFNIFVLLSPWLFWGFEIYLSIYRFYKKRDLV